MDWCISFTRKIQHGSDWERSRTQGPKNVHNFLVTVRPVSWACGHGTEMLLILKKYFRPDYSRGSLRYDSPTKCPTILYGVNLWLKPVPLITWKIIYGFTWDGLRFGQRLRITFHITWIGDIVQFCLTTGVYCYTRLTHLNKWNRLNLWRHNWSFPVKFYYLYFNLTYECKVFRRRFAV